MKKRKFLVAGIVLFAAIGFLTVMAFRGAVMYSYSVSELLKRGDVVLGQTVKAAGRVSPGSVSYESGNILKFIITEGGNQLPVVYQGVVPDTFKEDNEVTVEGQLDSSGIFQARTIMPKCASKYELE